MSKRKKIATGFTKQGVRSLDYIKGPPAGRRLSMPGASCDHPPYMVKEIDHNNSISQCKGCGSCFDFSGNTL